MKISSIAKLFVVLLIASQVTACGVLAVGGVAAGASIAADRRTPGVQAIDKGIELEAGNALAKKFGDNAHINVTAFNQKVLLTGEVKDADIKSEAGVYVKAMKNARSVFNELIIGPNSGYTARANDSYLESKIKTQMIFTDQLPSNSMAIVAEGSSIYLMGILTQNEASNTNGVKDVYVYFDIISQKEKVRLEKQGKADQTHPSSPPKFQ